VSFDASDIERRFCPHCGFCHTAEPIDLVEVKKRIAESFSGAEFTFVMEAVRQASQGAVITVNFKGEPNSDG
jgi:hypothetical protein